jgi:hypothetical protein
MKIFFKAIDGTAEKALAKAVIIQKHYLHRWPPASFIFGAFVEGRIKGVLVIGKPSSPTLQQVCGNEKVTDVYELNRLWMADDLPRNSESYFIAWCLRQIRKQAPTTILISYADTKQGHVGTVYQATNWTYTGTSIPFEDVDGQSGQRVKRSKKHRYIWFAKSEDKALLTWEQLPYPKRTSFIPELPEGDYVELGEESLDRADAPAPTPAPTTGLVAKPDLIRVTFTKAQLREVDEALKKVKLKGAVRVGNQLRFNAETCQEDGKALIIGLEEESPNRLDSGSVALSSARNAAIEVIYSGDGIKGRDLYEWYRVHEKLKLLRGGPRSTT